MIGLLFAISEAGMQGYHWKPQLGISTRFRHWLSQQDTKRCPTCKDQHGKIWRADYTLHIEGSLPNGYVTMKEARQAGWERGKDPRRFIYDKLITGGEYRNDDGHLPQKAGRFWQEADLSYLSGNRGAQRVVWSNDGLVFVTYDHYETFYEII